jgi:hypothetical protein
MTNDQGAGDEAEGTEEELHRGGRKIKRKR